jgi:PPM family protein phosphatase
VRTNNEDAVFAGERLIAVADGVGGSVFGEVASAGAIDAIAYLEAAPLDGDLAATASEALQRATDRLAGDIRRDESRRGMATTLTGLLVGGDRVVVLHVGDSRAYRRRTGCWEQLTRDDSLVQGLVDAGALTSAEAQIHPARSVVLQALNGGPVEPHVQVLELAAGDRYLLCSDGLSDYVEEAHIAQIVGAHPDADECCGALLDAALTVGAPDNVSCVIADVVEADGRAS